jgi:hypothetical protein
MILYGTYAALSKRFSDCIRMTGSRDSVQWIEIISWDAVENHA